MPIEISIDSIMTHQLAGTVHSGRLPYTALPNWLYQCEEISGHELLVLGALNLYAEGLGGGAVFPSHATLAAKAKISTSSLKRVLVQLREKGLITWEQQFIDNQQKSNKYTLLIWNPEVVRSLSLSEGRSLTVSEGVAHTELGGSSQRATEQEPSNKTHITKPPLVPPEGGTPKKKKAPPFKPTADDVPPSLTGYTDQILKFWHEHRSSKGVKTEKAWTGMMTSIAQILAHKEGGAQVLLEQFAEAQEKWEKDTPWQSISFTNWKKYGSKKLPQPASGGKPARDTTFDRSRWNIKTAADFYA